MSTLSWKGYHVHVRQAHEHACARAFVSMNIPLSGISEERNRAARNSDFHDSLMRTGISCCTGHFPNCVLFRHLTITYIWYEVHRPRPIE